MRINEFKKMLDYALNSKTIYMRGCFGQPITDALLKQKQKQYPSWYTTERMKKFKALVGKNYFGFDCIGLIKGILWGWCGDFNKELGGAVYQSNGVPDGTELDLINSCKNVSKDFSNITTGELLYMKGHCGIYAGKVNGIDYCYECTVGGTGNVQYRPMSKQKWEKHGKLPYIEYVMPAPVCPYKEPTTTLYKGCEKGEGVSWLQWYLVRLGFLSAKLANGKNSIDGSFGLATHEAVIKFQTTYPECGGSDGKPDGRIGKASRAKLKTLV